MSKIDRRQPRSCAPSSTRRSTAPTFPELGEKYEGKVRDCYIARRPAHADRVTDRISAFDVVLGTIPFKGQVLNQLAAFWFEETADLAPNHVLRRARSRP